MSDEFYGFDDEDFDEETDEYCFECNNMGVIPCECEANARLIAAAPELYEALKSVQLLFAPEQVFVVSKMGGGITNGDQDRIDLVFSKLDAALAKAVPNA